MPFRNPERPKGPFRNGPKGHLTDGDPEMADAFPKWRYFINTVALKKGFKSEKALALWGLTPFLFGYFI